MSGGRPSLCTPELTAKLCERLADGESLRKICQDEDMPDKETVRRWCRDNPEFRAQYARAREDQADTHADEIVDIADTETDPQKARVRIDARKWTAAKLRPKRYGDKVALTGGGPGDPPIRIDLSNLSDEELETLERIRSKLAVSSGDQSGEGETSS